MEFFNDKTIWKHSPIVTTVLLEASNIGHLIRMWTEGTAEGQSLTSWVFVGMALALWYNWYRLFAPDQKIPRYTCLFGIVMNAVVIGTVVWLRYFS